MSDPSSNVSWSTFLSMSTTCETPVYNVSTLAYSMNMFGMYSQNYPQMILLMREL